MSFDSCFESSAMNFTAWTVFFVWSVTRFSSFWTKLPKHIMKAIKAMFESISCDWPIAIGWPLAFSFGAALSTWSHVRGRLADVVPQVVPPHHRVGHVTVGDGEV